jgi:hypothetical protein
MIFRHIGVMGVAILPRTPTKNEQERDYNPITKEFAFFFQRKGNEIFAGKQFLNVPID